MNVEWADKATLFEGLSLALLFTQEETIEALVSGEFAAALDESAQACKLDATQLEQAIASLEAYRDADSEALLHRIRTEYTRLFIGTPKAVVSPYAGIWYAGDKGTDPLVFVNKESMAVERFILSCGLTRPENTNEPLDHIGTELEFLSYLCFDKAGMLDPEQAPPCPDDAYQEFYRDHFSSWSKDFAHAVIAESKEALFTAAAQVLLLLPDDRW